MCGKDALHNGGSSGYHGSWDKWHGKLEWKPNTTWEPEKCLFRNEKPFAIGEGEIIKIINEFLLINSGVKQQSLFD